ncbi:MAG TPA: flavin reductase family protein [Ilumatobacteraceae bacterium]|nr:flavin reductase family protein [Ilumatobacteraceae bacterium]
MHHVYDFSAHGAGTNQGLLSQLVVPRPIAMVSTRDVHGAGNLSPFSYYMPVTGSPPLVTIAFGARESDGDTKGSFQNLMASGDFVINVCSEVFADHIEGLAKEYPHGVDEAAVHGFTWRDSQRVSSPAVAEASAALECIVHTTFDLGDETAPVTLVVGEVLCAVIDDSVLASSDLDHPRIDLLALAPIGRSGARTFIRAIEQAVYHQERHPYVPEPDQQQRDKNSGVLRT